MPDFAIFAQICVKQLERTWLQIELVRLFMAYVNLHWPRLQQLGLQKRGSIWVSLALYRIRRVFLRVVFGTW